MIEEMVQDTKGSTGWDGTAGLKTMIDSYLVAVMAGHGYGGKSRNFTRRERGLVGRVSMQLSVHNTKHVKEFTYNLVITKDGQSIWTGRIGDICPEAHDLWWKLDGESSIHTIGPTVAEHLGLYACTWIDVIMADPSRGQIPENAKSYVQANHDGPEVPLDQFQEYVSRQHQIGTEAVSWTLADVLRHTESSDPIRRLAGFNVLWRRWPEHPRSFQYHIDTLEKDPEPLHRAASARALGFLLNANARALLTEHAALDEDCQVRWSARYALTLLEGRKSEEGGLR